MAQLPEAQKNGPFGGPHHFGAGELLLSSFLESQIWARIEMPSNATSSSQMQLDKGSAQLLSALNTHSLSTVKLKPAACKSYQLQLQQYWRLVPGWLKTRTAEEQRSKRCGACPLCALCCVRGSEALGSPRGLGNERGSGASCSKAMASLVSQVV